MDDVLVHLLGPRNERGENGVQYTIYRCGHA